MFIFNDLENTNKVCTIVVLYVYMHT